MNKEANNNQIESAVNPSSTQNSLEIAELREGMAVMRDGSFRAVIACKSINYDLMSTRERENVEYAYQSFLNSLTFPIQVLIRSQRVDIEPYINKLTNIYQSQDNMLLQKLMLDYINFIDSLSQNANIMDKSFFVVVPYFPAGDLTSLKDQTKGFFGKIFTKPNNQITKIDRETWDKARDEMKNRIDGITGGLYQMGIRSTQLNTKELGELFYNFYNPDTAVREPLGNFEESTTTFVKKATQTPNQGGYNG